MGFLLLLGHSGGRGSSVRLSQAHWPFLFWGVALSLDFNKEKGPRSPCTQIPPNLLGFLTPKHRTFLSQGSTLSVRFFLWKVCPSPAQGKICVAFSDSADKPQLPQHPSPDSPIPGLHPSETPVLCLGSPLAPPCPNRGLRLKTVVEFLSCVSLPSSPASNVRCPRTT